ncbi:tetratricopeptide repeat protein [Candidatus Halobeggiatoa sp. HSG11]|nr:tetratricopeptide repeat protein [Candidatus Halobeggiatoa sp. HSG11]
MNNKVFYKTIEVILIIKLLTGCATQTTLGEVENDQPKIKTQFVSEQQEYVYKILIAEVARLRGANALAARNFFEVASKTEDLIIIERATQHALIAQDYNLAMQAARLWVTVVPNNPYARQVLGRVLLQQKHTDEAVIHLETMIDTFKDNSIQLSSVLEDILEQHQDRNQVIELLEKLLVKRPNNPTILLLYSQIQLQEEQFEPALKSLRKLLDIKPKHTEAVPLYALTLDQIGKTEEALQWMQKSLTKSPNNSEWRLMYARMLADAEQFEESIRQFESVASEHPDNADILYALGILFIHTNRFSEAKSNFLNLIRLGERVNSANYYLGHIAQQNNNLDKALFWYKKVKGGPAYLNTQARIALVMVEQKRLDEAVEYLRNVPVDDTEEAVSLIQLGAELLIERKRYEPALEMYNHALVYTPNNPDLLYMRALLYEKMGKIKDVETSLRRLLVNEPNNVNAMNALGYTLANNTNRYQEAYDLIKRAMTLGGEEYYILDSMGWILYKMNNYVESIAYLRKALAKHNDAEIAAHLGEVLWQNKEHHDAERIWYKALQDSPKNENLKKVIQRFSPKLFKKVKSEK